MQPLVTSPRKDIHKRKLVLGMSVGVVKAEKMYYAWSREMEVEASH